MSLSRIRVDLVFVSKDFDQYSDEIDVFEFIVVSILSFTPDYTA